MQSRSNPISHPLNPSGPPSAISTGRRIRAAWTGRRSTQNIALELEAAASTEAARAIMREMIGRLKQTHFAIFPAAVYQVLDADGGGAGWPGFDARVLDGRVIVTDVYQPQVSAFFGATQASSKQDQAGWEILQANGVDLAPLVAKLQTDPAIHELQLERAVAARLSGQVGASAPWYSPIRTTRGCRLDVKLLAAARRILGLRQSASAAGLV